MVNPRWRLENCKNSEFLITWPKVRLNTIPTATPIQFGHMEHNGAISTIIMRDIDISRKFNRPARKPGINLSARNFASNSDIITIPTQNTCLQWWEHNCASPTYTCVVDIIEKIKMATRKAAKPEVLVTLPKLIYRHDSNGKYVFKVG